MGDKELLSYLVGQVPFSQQSLNAISKTMCTNKALQAAGCDVLKHKRWVLFKESLVFAESIGRLLQENVSQQGPVAGLMSGIEKYADFSECMEKVFSNLSLACGTGLLTRIGNNYLNSHLDVLGLFAGVMAKHPKNATLTTHVCNNLAFLVKLQDMLGVHRSESVTRTYGCIALKIFRDFPAENSCINSASSLHDSILRETHNGMALLSYPVSGFDLMSLMFEILRVECIGDQKDRKDNTVSVCTKKILLQSDWTVVMALTSPKKKHPVDVILDMMVVNPNRYGCQYHGCLLLEHYLRGTNKTHSVGACVQVLTRLLRQCFNGTFFYGFSESRNAFFCSKTGEPETKLLSVLCTLVNRNDAGCTDALIKYGTLVHVLDVITRLQGNYFALWNGPVNPAERREQSCIDNACLILERVSTRQDDPRVYETLVEGGAISTLLHTIKYQQHAKISRRFGRAHSLALTSIHNILTGIALDASRELTGLKYEDVVLQNYAVGNFGGHRSRRTLCDFMFSEIYLETETPFAHRLTRMELALVTQCNILLHMSHNPAVCGEMIAYMPPFVDRIVLELSERALFKIPAGEELPDDIETRSFIQITTCVNCILIEMIRLYPQCLKTPTLCRQISAYMRNNYYQVDGSFQILAALFQPQPIPV